MTTGRTETAQAAPSKFRQTTNVSFLPTTIKAGLTKQFNSEPLNLTPSQDQVEKTVDLIYTQSTSKSVKNMGCQDPVEKKLT